jgi:hypothetical protein
MGEQQQHCNNIINSNCVESFLLPCETRVIQKQPETPKVTAVAVEKKYFEKSRYLVAPKATSLPLPI